VIDIITDSIATCVGQLFIYYIVHHFRQHIVPLIISTRKILSGIASIIIFKHHVNKIQWLALIFIVLGTIY
jgi:drug/metabolite transporter (DMT)-like permease